jgi:hypothetical protein
MGALSSLRGLPAISDISASPGRRKMHIRPVIAVVLTLWSACAAAGAAAAEVYTDEDVRGLLAADLETLQSTVETTMKTATSAINREAESSRERRKADHWRKFVEKRIDDALDNKDPLEALLNAWTASSQILHYLVDGQGQGLFGDRQEAAIHAATAIDDRLVFLAQHYIPEDRLEQARERIDQYVAANPIRFSSTSGNLFVPAEGTLSTTIDFGRKTLGDVIRLPLAPQKLAADFGRGSQGLEGISVAAERFTDVVEKTPEQIRLELEALFERLGESQEEIERILGEIRTISENARETAVLADRVVVNIDTPIQSVAEMAPRIQEAAESIRSASAETARLIDSISALIQQTAEQSGAAEKGPRGPGGFRIQDYAESGPAIQAAAAEVRLMLGEIQELTAKTQSSKAESRPDSRPFDIREYRDTAQAIGDGAAEIRESLAELDRMLEQDVLPKGLGRVEESVRHSLEAAPPRFSRPTRHGIAGNAQRSRRGCYLGGWAIRSRTRLMSWVSRSSRSAVRASVSRSPSQMRRTASFKCQPYAPCSPPNPKRYANRQVGSPQSST